MSKHGKAIKNVFNKMNIIEAVKKVFNLYRNFNKKIEEEEVKENE
jgi:hypothetical protein